jgi:hyperosmotically inducible protein
MNIKSAINDGKAMINDATITSKIKAKYFKEDALDAMDIHVTTENGKVKLSGEVCSPKDISHAIEIAKNTDGVKMVESKLTIKT